MPNAAVFLLALLVSGEHHNALKRVAELVTASDIFLRHFHTIYSHHLAAKAQLYIYSATKAQLYIYSAAIVSIIVSVHIYSYRWPRRCGLYRCREHSTVYIL